jgi:hypothetical protein
MALIGQGLHGATANGEIMARLAPLGYTAEKMEAGLSLYRQTQGEVTAHQKEYGEQYSAYEQLESLWVQQQQGYRRLLDLCRVGLKNKAGALHSLRATGSRNRSLTGFIKDARFLYQNLLDQPELLQAMEAFGVTAAQLSESMDKVQELESAHLRYMKERGEAQDKTIRRDELFDALYDWYSDFRAVARIALADAPQLMEGLGVVVKR